MQSENHLRAQKNLFFRWTRQFRQGDKSRHRPSILREWKALLAVKNGQQPQRKHGSNTNEQAVVDVDFETMQQQQLHDEDDVTAKFVELVRENSIDIFLLSDDEQDEKRVDFHPTCRMRFTMHMDEYTDEEYYACWYTPEELTDMKHDLLDTLHRLERKEAVDEINDTFRGLETQTKTAQRHKGQRRTMAIETVVGLYYKQVKSGKKFDMEYVAGAYKECNKASELAAYISGIGDQGTARDLDMSFNTMSIRKKKGIRRCGFSLVAS